MSEFACPVTTGGGSVRLSTSGGIATCTLDRPEAYNAINLPMAKELRAIASAVEGDEAIRVLVINGAGRGFCAGGDIATVAANLDRLDAAVREFLAEFNVFLTALRHMDKIVVTSVHGVAAGAGLALALMGDICVADADATFSPAYASLGVTPDCGGTVGVVDAIGARRALQLFLLEDRLTADEAKTLGLVNKVVPSGSLTIETSRIATRLASLEPRCAAGTKRLVNQSASTPITQQLSDEANTLIGCMQLPAYREAINRFLSSSSGTRRS
jgi:enoyl-CoA hydratase/carnithine racemase